MFRQQLAAEGASLALSDTEAVLSGLITSVRGDTMAQLREAFDAQYGGFGRCGSCGSDWAGRTGMESVAKRMDSL